jgi:hypothetical protein
VESSFEEVESSNIKMIAAGIKTMSSTFAVISDISE